MVPLNKTSKKFRIAFMLKFTEQLILHSETPESIILRERLRRKIKSNIEKKVNEQKLNEMIISRSFEPEKPHKKEKKIPYSEIKKRYSIKRSLIPQTRLPPTVKDITPLADERKLNLGKLNPLINDPTVITMQCDGSGEKITVKRTNGEHRTTGIILDKEEINEIIKKFSQASKIPLQEGVFKTAIGKLLISAIIHNEISSRFIITKISKYYK